MIFLNIYVNLIRITAAVLAIYHIYKREYKAIVPTVAVFILTFLIAFLNKLFDIKIDFLGSVLYFTIIFMSIYLGSVQRFYDRYAWWDRLIHFLSGIAFVSFGVALSRDIQGLSKFNVLFFSFTLSVTLHVVWEVMEYIVDCGMRTNHQRWQKVHNSRLHTPETAIQPAGLADTMNDTVICSASIIMACVVWWFVL